MKTVIVPPVNYGAAVVRRFEGIVLSCPNPLCPDRSIMATFDEVQRIIPCPSCGSEIFVPEHYRGMP